MYGVVEGSIARLTLQVEKTCAWVELARVGRVQRISSISAYCGRIFSRGAQLLVSVTQGYRQIAPSPRVNAGRIKIHRVRVCVTQGLAAIMPPNTMNSHLASVKPIAETT